jgi:hypothetical protein
MRVDRPGPKSHSPTPQNKGTKPLDLQQVHTESVPEMEHDNLHEAPETVEIHDDKSHEGKLSVLLGVLKK